MLILDNMILESVFFARGEDPPTAQVDLQSSIFLIFTQVQKQLKKSNSLFTGQTDKLTTEPAEASSERFHQPTIFRLGKKNKNQDWKQVDRRPNCFLHEMGI